MEVNWSHVCHVWYVGTLVQKNDEWKRKIGRKCLPQLKHQQDL